MNKETSCINSIVILDYLKKHSIDYPALLKDLHPEIDGLEDPERFLRDPTNWITCEVIGKLYQRATDALKDDRTAYKMGRFGAENVKLGYAQRIVIKAFWSTQKALKHCQKINDQWNRSKKLELHHVKPNEAVIRLHWNPGMHPTKHICQYNQGAYTYLPLLWGGRPLSLKETCCHFDGAPYCEYHIKWPFTNRLKEIFSRFFAFKSVLLETIEEMEKDKHVIEQKSEKLMEINRELQQKIAQQKQAEDALRKSETKYRELFEHSPVGIFKTTSSGRAIFVNPEMARIVGASSPEDAVKNFQDLARDLYVDPDRREDFIETLQKEGIAENFEYEAWGADGKHLWLSMNARICDKKPDGTFTIDGFTTNITERKQMEDALRESEEKYRDMVENINDVIFTTDPGGKITFISPRVQSVMGFQPLELLSKNFASFVHPEDLPGILDRHMELLCGILRPSEYRLVTKSGAYRWVRSSSRPIYGKNGVTGLKGVFADITDQKQIEAQLQQARKIESIGTLTGGIAHDFNNILSIIIGNTELALDHVSEESPLHENLEEIEAAGRRAANVVKQLMNFSRKEEPALKAIDIVPIIKETLLLLRSVIPSTIDIRQQIQISGETIFADPTQIHQAIMNLCVNASQAMEHSGGILTVRAEISRLRPESSDGFPDLKRGDYLKVSVSDTGPGIDPGIIDRIFDPYFTTKPVGKGSGMGLAVVHGIVKNHHGDISIDSIPGKGACFNLLFPLTHRHQAPAVEDTPRPHAATSAERILIVDDEASIVKATRLMLENLGYSVEIATSADAALEIFSKRAEAFDLVITDMTMPKMNGVTLSQKLLEIRKDIPIIVCTGYSSLIDEERAKDLGIAKLVLKPLSGQKMALTIRAALDRIA